MILPKTIFFPAAATALLLLITFAHLSPSTNFTVPYFPSSAVVVPYLPPHLSDGDNRQLTRAQCLERYPALYHEADRAKRWYSKGISLEMVNEADKDGANARLAIINNKLYVKAFYGGVNTRTQAVIAAIYSTVLSSPESMPDVEYVTAHTHFPSTSSDLEAER
jgi:hypothetical protein